LRISGVAGGGVRLSVDRIDVVVRGQTIQGGRDLSAAEVRAGVVLELSERVFLLLHTLGLAAPRAPQFGLVGESEALERVRMEISRVSSLDVPVLIRGETGTGKELVAKAIHQASPRASRTFLAVNLAAVPASTAAAELFGHVAGAFTGAQKDAPGVFALADKGTLFLDEVGETTQDVQATLLRVLETGELQPVRGRPGRRVDVRVLSATDADLEGAAREGRFRQALLHRLEGYVLTIPPLRERRDDVGRLFAHFLREELKAVGEEKRISTLGGKSPWLPQDVVGPLLRHEWPGNVRQLRNSVRQVVVASRGEPRARLPAAFEKGLERGVLASPTAPPTAHRKPSEISEADLLATLRQQAWQTGLAARALGISRTSLYALIEGSTSIRKAKDIPLAELKRAHAECSGDIEQMSAKLEVSRHGLRLRMRDSGLD
jgi:two-component system nitrogen regulation response regulator GlnG